VTGKIPGIPPSTNTTLNTVQVPIYEQRSSGQGQGQAIWVKFAYESRHYYYNSIHVVTRENKISKNQAIKSKLIDVNYRRVNMPSSRLVYSD